MALCRAQSVGGSEKDLSCRCGMQVKGAETGQLMTRGIGGLVGRGEMLGEGVGKPYYSVCWFPHPHSKPWRFPSRKLPVSSYFSLGGSRLPSRGWGYSPG